MRILANKWNQLAAAQMTMNDGNPDFIENWYMALWAYNTGINPQASTGNTSGCTPGPSCTDGDGNWGLGWTNNPANPDYPPEREVFLRTTYDDARHPSDWPYQERILGWAETPIQIPWGHSAYDKAVAGPKGNPAGCRRGCCGRRSISITTPAIMDCRTAPIPGNELPR